MARRYGWPPGIIDQTDWRISVYAAEQEESEYLDNWKRSAFVAFQLGAGKSGQSFGDYLKSVGLKEVAKKEPKKKRSERAQASIKDALRIMSKDKKRSAK